MKRIFAMLLCLCIGLALAACGGNGEGAQTGGEVKTEASKTEASSKSESSGSSETADPSENKDPVPDLVMACNAVTNEFGIYDMSLFEEGCSLEDLLIWSCDVGEGGDMKYREDTVFGDVIVTTGSNRAAIISYPEGKVIWETDNPGNNPHSMEILPSGNVIVANSTGGTLRFFRTSALLSNDTETAREYTEYLLEGAHGVLWDPEYECVWALGDYELVCFLLSGSGENQRMTKLNGSGAKLPAGKQGGHDLSADFTSKQHLYLTVNSTVFRFDKETNTLDEKFKNYAKLTGSAVKGFSNNSNGNFFYSKVNNGPGTSWENETFAEWCTDRIHYCYMKSEHFMYVQEIVSEDGAFYKIRAFEGSYQ